MVKIAFTFLFTCLVLFQFNIEFSKLKGVNIALTILIGKSCVLLNPVQEFIEIEV